MQKNKATLSPEEKSRSKRVYIVFASLMLLGVLLALFTPENILTHPWANAWTEFILGNTFPKLLDVPRLSSIPQVVAFYHATMLAAFVLHSIVLCYILFRNHFERRVHPPEAYFLQHMGSRMKCIGMFFFVITFYIVLFFLLKDGYGVDENSFSITKHMGLMFASRFSLCIGAIIFPWTGALFLSVAAITWALFFIYLYPYLPWFQKKQPKAKYKYLTFKLKNRFYK